MIKIAELDAKLIEWYKAAYKEELKLAERGYEPFTPFAHHQILGHCLGCISTIKEVWIAVHGEEMSNEVEHNIRQEALNHAS